MMLCWVGLAWIEWDGVGKFVVYMDGGGSSCV